MKLLPAILSSIAFFSQAHASVGEPTIDEIIASDPQLETLQTYVERSGVTLESGREYTVFAPSNEAFAHLPGEIQQRLSQDPALLPRLILHHVTPGVYPGDRLLTSAQLATLDQQSVRIYSLPDSVIGIDQARIVGRDIRAANGIIHVIDRVLLPSFGEQPDIVDVLRSQPDFRVLSELLDQAGLIDTLRGTQQITLFAPDDAAFAAVPPDALEDLRKDRDALRNALLRHVVLQRLDVDDLQADTFVTTANTELLQVRVVPGGGVTINQVPVADEVVQIGNREIRRIRGLLLPLHR
jgi:uncharacterized surface protein with fasciclin (FAS1) repeats